MQTKKLPWISKAEPLLLSSGLKLPIVHFQDIKKCNGKLEKLDEAK